MNNTIVYAIHNFEAENEDEINFLIGEPIMVLEKDEKYLDGWWQGRNINGETGLFPMNYTSPEKPAHIQTDYDPMKIFKDHLQQEYTPKSHLSSRSSGSTVEEEIDEAISQLQITSPPSTLPRVISPSPSKQDLKDNKPEIWDVNQVADWLHSVGLGSVSANFIDQEITGDILLDLNIEALKELGINTFGKRYKIMQAINSLKDQEVNLPTPMTSVSTSAVPRPTSRMSATLKRSNSQSNDVSDALYQFPRKAPLPPGLDPPNRPLDSQRPISPTSLSSSGISRSNTFNTVSSGGTMRSRELSPDLKGFTSPRRGLSQKSHHTMDSFEKETPANNKNDWYTNETNEQQQQAIHPLNSQSTPSPNKPMQISNAHKLSVSSFDEKRSSTTEAFQAPEHEGWLHKQSDKYKTWNKRWFVLKGTNLFYFKSPKDVRMKGIINLRGYKIIVDETIHAGKYCFKAQHDRERTFFFYTDTEESMRIWLKMLMKTTIARDFRAPVMSSNHIATVSLDVARRMRPRPPSVIMYKNQKQMNKLNDPKMTMLEEEEEHYHPQQPQAYRQTRESGITVYPSNTTIAEEDIPEVPRYPPEHLLINDEEEDLIDPQHRSLPLSSSRNSVTSSISNHSSSGGANNHHDLSYIDWINTYLPPGKKVIDLTSAFRNGDTLIQLLEGISGKQVRRPPVQKGGSMSVQMLDNIVAAFKFMGREGVEVDGRYTIKDVFGGNETKIITMLDAIKTWADRQYPNNHGFDNHMNEEEAVFTKKSDTSVLINKNSGWRGSAMMDNRLSDEDF